MTELALSQPLCDVIPRAFRREESAVGPKCRFLVAEAIRNDNLEKGGVTQNRDPVVSVIVPARNEEACLARCLESLVGQTAIDFEIIVVDDASTDRTAEIARSFMSPGEDARGATTCGATSLPTRPSNLDSGATSPATRANNLDSGAAGVPARPRVTVISAPPLPENWTGKNNAMSAGAKVAYTKAKWLLFTDADTVHKPGSLARAVAEAEQNGAALLSYSPEQEVCSFWERAVMPVIFAELAATYPSKKVNDPASPIAAANGQYLLISREAYDAVGGHATIANDLLEDVAMARLVKSAGRKIFFRYGGDAVRTRMYRNWPQMKEGWTKNLALLFAHPVRRASILGAAWAFSWGTFIFGLAAIYSGYWRIAYCLLPLLSFYGRIARGQFGRANNLVAVSCGIPTAVYLLLKSAGLHKNGEVIWKGRTYPDWSRYSARGPVASNAFMEGVEDLPVQERRP